MTNIERVEEIEVAGQAITVIRKRIQNLHVGVYPPEGRVRVAAPCSIGLEAIRVAVLTRLSWIKRKQAEFRQQAREPQREFVSGETHYVFGRPYRLVVEEGLGRQGIYVGPGGRLVMRIHPGVTSDDRERQMSRWLRRKLRERAAPRIQKWAERLGVSVPTCGIRRMKTKWGSCSPAKGLIWINLELSKKPTSCLDYVILHEMAHFVSPVTMRRLFRSWTA